jgi:hypothetical protein
MNLKQEYIKTLEQVVSDNEEYFEKNEKGELSSQDREYLSDSMLSFALWAKERLTLLTK